MSRFADDAQRLFDAAETASTHGEHCTPMTLLIGQDHSIRVVAESDWPLDSLMLLHGSRTGYRVSEHAGNVRLEGREGSRKCTLESVTPARAALLLRAPSWTGSLLVQAQNL